MSQLYPISNAGNLYINGLGIYLLTYSNRTVLGIAPGQCRDSNNIIDILVPDDAITPSVVNSPGIEISLTATGAGGLDIGTIEASTLYLVYVIASSNGYAPVAGILTKQIINYDHLASPVLPPNYDSFRYVGAIYVDSGSLITPFGQFGDGHERVLFYDDYFSILSAGHATTFTLLTTSRNYVPPTAGTLILQAQINPATAGNLLSLRPLGSASTTGNVQISGQVASVNTTTQVMCLNGNGIKDDQFGAIEYKVSNASDSAAISVSGYINYLGGKLISA